MGNNTSINAVNEENTFIATEEERTKYLYNFMSKKEVDKMTYNEKYFYSLKFFSHLFVNKYKNKEVINDEVCLYYFLTNLNEFKEKILSLTENLNENKWKRACLTFELPRRERVKLQNFLNSISNYEKFMFEVSISIRDKLYDKFRTSKKIVFIEDENDDKVIPLVGLHSTTSDSYKKILKGGFNPPKEKIYGKVEGEKWPVAMFTNPFLNFTQVYSYPRYCGRGWQTQIITLTNGIIRMLRSGESEFPIIIAIFKDIGKKNDLKAGPNSYIESFDPKNILIIGKIDVKFSDDVLKNMRSEFVKEGKFDDQYHPKLPLDYTINWFI